MRHAFFVGCTVLARLWGYEISTRRVAERLGVELVDMPGSGCCGATYLETLDHKTGMAVAAIIGLILDNLIPGTLRERGIRERR